MIEYLKNIVNNKKYVFAPAQKVNQKVDYSGLIAKEKNKLKRAKEAYLAEIDTVEEYKENKARITKTISALEKQQAESQKEITVDLDEFSKKVNQVILTIEDPQASEKSKNEALRSIIDRIIYKKPSNTLAFFFHV